MERNFHAALIDQDRFYVDVGIVVTADKWMVDEIGGHTWMWRGCCLDKAAEAFQMNGFKGSKVEPMKYNWCLTRDIGSLERRHRSVGVQ